MKKFLVKICIYGMITLCISNAIAWGGMYILRNSDLYKPSYLIRNLNNKIPLDYVILGSSTGLTGFNTHAIDSMAHTNGFNLSLDGIGPSGQYMILNFFFDKGYRTNRLFLTVDSLTANDASVKQISMNEYYFLPWLGEDYVYQCFKNREDGWFKVLSYSRYAPILGFSYYNQQLLGSCFLALKNTKQKWHFDDKGNESYTSVLQPSAKSKIPVRHDTLRISNPYIHQIEKLCENNGVELIYVLPPQWKRSTLFSNSKKHKAINLRNIFNDSPEYFSDEMHVNINGRQVLSEKIANLLKSNK